MDRIGTRKGFSLAIVFWSLAAMGHALARTVFGFGVARFFLGLGEAGNFPASDQDSRRVVSQEGTCARNRDLQLPEPTSAHLLRHSWFR